MIKLLQVSNGVALIVTIIINYLSTSGVFNGITISTASARYQSFFTPAGYSFSIWIPIYFGLILFVIYQGTGLFKKIKAREVVSQIGWWFVVSCTANCFWVLAWLYEFIGLSVLLMLILVFSLLKIVVNTNMELDNATFTKVAFVWWPFSLYSGWMAVALIANAAAYLTKIIWDAFGISEISWTIIMICVAGIINLLMTWVRNMREFALVGVWALVAVGVANWKGAQSIVLTAFVVSAILFVSSLIHAYKNRNSFPWKIKVDH